MFNSHVSPVPLSPNNQATHLTSLPSTREATGGKVFEDSHEFMDSRNNSMIAFQVHAQTLTSELDVLWLLTCDNMPSGVEEL